jgi:phospholipid/cholesterol/gamma-HCH transport system ATP-binding protein
MGTANAIIQVHGLKTCFGKNCVHDNLDLEVRAGELIAIVGGSGSGKSTLLREIMMLHRPSAGEIYLFGEKISDLHESQADRMRRRFGVMFQQGALFSSLNLLENVAVPLREHTKLSRHLIEELAVLKIVLAGLPTSAVYKYPRELSGGMLKRAAVARALALDPELIFLDEPTAGLDPVSAGDFDELVLQLKESLGLTIVMVTHDLDTLWRTTDRVAFLGEKRVLRYASMRELSRDEHPLIKHYFQGPRGRVAQQVATH